MKSLFLFGLGLVAGFCLRHGMKEPEAPSTPAPTRAPATPTPGAWMRDPHRRTLLDSPARR